MLQLSLCLSFDDESFTNIIGFYFVANYLGPEVIGTVVFAGGFIGAFSFLVDPGLNITHIKKNADF